MATYREIESEFLQGVTTLAIGEGRIIRENAMNTITGRHPELTEEQNINIRLYFNSAGTLEGLAEWAAGFSSK